MTGAIRPTHPNNISFVERIGMYPELAIGYLGLLLFMIGDGVEAGFLSLMLTDMRFGTAKVALVFTAYGASAALGSWLSGALSDIFGPKKVMWAGLLIWLGFEIPVSSRRHRACKLQNHCRQLWPARLRLSLLCLRLSLLGRRRHARALPRHRRRMVLVRAHRRPSHARRAARQFCRAPHWRLQNPVGLRRAWSPSADSSPCLLVKEKRGTLPLSTTGENPLAVLFTGVSILWRHPKVALGGIVATITTTSEFGFLVCLPIFYVQKVGFTEGQWLQIVSIIFATNVVANLFWGWVGDKIGWRRTITFVGACGCALTTMGLFYVPHIFGPNFILVMLAGMAYGIALAGFVPIAAIMAVLAPESRGASMSIMNLGSGLSMFTGPAIVGIFQPMFGISGVIWIFALHVPDRRRPELHAPHPRRPVTPIRNRNQYPQLNHLLANSPPTPGFPGLDSETRETTTLNPSANPLTR